MNRWRREFNKAVKLPARDTIFDYFLSFESDECLFEPWTKHKIFKVVDFDSNTMQMNEVVGERQKIHDLVCCFLFLRDVFSSLFCDQRYVSGKPPCG